MEQEYVIGVANRYALFLEENSHEDDPFDILKNAEVEKTKKKTLKSTSGESKENKGKQNLKGKTTLPTVRKTQGIKETQNVKPIDAGALKPKLQDGGNKSNRVAGGRKLGERPQGDRPQTAGDGPIRTAKFASGEPQADRNNRRPRDEKFTGERNGDVARNRSFREGERAPKGSDNEYVTRGPRNDEGRRGPRRDGERPFRSERERSDRQDGEKPVRRENRERRDFQDRMDLPREGMENGEIRPDRRSGPPMGRTKNSRGGGPGRNFDSRGKREFDRKSGSDKTFKLPLMMFTADKVNETSGVRGKTQKPTRSSKPKANGVKAIDKREGGGAHNWGNHKDDFEAINLNSTNASEENADGPEGKTGFNEEGTNELKEGEKNAVDGENALPSEEEPKELTLDEYRALRGKRELPQYNIRKAGEGEDLTQWKNMYEIKKKKETENHENEEDLDGNESLQKSGRQRVLLDIPITFSDFRGIRGGRGGRAPRPGDVNSNSANNRTRQRDGPRRGSQREDFGGNRDRKFRGNRQAAPKVNDEHDFPSLG